MAGKELIRVETVTYVYVRGGKKRVEEQQVLIYEDQPEQLTERTALNLFLRFPHIKEIHELHPVWGGVWTKPVLREKTGTNRPKSGGINQSSVSKSTT